MIEYEDSKIVLDMDFDLIIPFEIHEGNILAFDVLKDIAEEFQIKFADDYFIDEAFDFLHEKIKLYTDKWGYTVARLYTWEYYYEINTVNTEVILDSTKKDGDRFVTMIDGNIVSFAEENMGEIGVETISEYQNKGYAASNVAALAKYLTDSNIKVSYYCDRYNIASQRIAEKVGFEITNKYYFYRCYKNGE